MATTSDINIGSFIRHEGELCVILEYMHRTPGNLRAFYQAKMRKTKSGKLVEYRFRSGEEVELVRVETKDLQFLYKEGDSLVCMDLESFEQITVPEELFGNAAQFLKEEMMVNVSMDGDNIVYAKPPKTVDLKITYTEPGVRGDTANKVLKPATVETGAEVMVPIFVTTDELIRIDTETGEYRERIKN